MVWLIVGAIAMFVIAYLLNDSIQKQDIREGVLIRDEFAKYIGGFSDLAGGKDASILIKEDCINIFIGGVADTVKKTMPMDIVKNAEIKSEAQISKEVTMGRLLIFGPLAFAMKKEKNKVKNYLVITCEKEGQEKSFIFESKCAENIVREVRRIKNITDIF